MGVQFIQMSLFKKNDYRYLDPMNVRSCYAESKSLGETMFVAWTKQYDIHFNVVRPFHTYGPRDYHSICEFIRR